MRRPILVVSHFILAVGVTPAHADSGQDSKAAARLQFMVRQLSSEKEALAAENARLNAEVEDVRKKFGDLRGKAQTALTQFKEQSDNLTGKLRDTEARLLELQQAHTKQTSDLQVCAQYNVNLYDSHRTLLKDYDRKGVFSSLLQLEPVTGLKQVAVENMIEQYRERIDQWQIKPASPMTKDSGESVPAPGQVVEAVNTARPEENGPSLRTKRGSVDRVLEEGAR